MRGLVVANLFFMPFDICAAQTDMDRQTNRWMYRQMTYRQCGFGSKNWFVFVLVDMNIFYVQLSMSVIVFNYFEPSLRALVNSLSCNLTLLFEMIVFRC